MADPKKKGRQVRNSLPPGYNPGYYTRPQGQIRTDDPKKLPGVDFKELYNPCDGLTVGDVATRNTAYNKYFNKYKIRKQ